MYREALALLPSATVLLKSEYVDDGASKSLVL
jgi:hypothetical protein